MRWKILLLIVWFPLGIGPQIGRADSPIIKPDTNDKRFHQPLPPYPFIARRKGVTGTCVVRLVADDKGKVIKATITRSSGSDVLDTNTKQFVTAQWRGPAKSVWIQEVKYELP